MQLSTWLKNKRCYTLSKKAIIFFLYKKPGGGGDLVTNLCLTLATPWTVACQALWSRVFPRQEYCSGLPLPSPSMKPRSRQFSAQWGYLGLGFFLFYFSILLFVISWFQDDSHRSRSHNCVQMRWWLREEGQVRVNVTFLKECHPCLSKLQEMVKDREAQHAAVHEAAKSWTWLSDWTMTTTTPVLSQKYAQQIQGMINKKAHSYQGTLCSKDKEKILKAVRGRNRLFTEEK